MRALVTGATGFLGSHTVDALLARGHDVTAVVRPQTDHDLPSSVDVVRLDLRSSAGLDEALQGVDVVVHCAAAKVGDLHTQFAGTVAATENLLAAMRRAGTERIVSVSSFAVYDPKQMTSGGTIDEDAPLVDPASARDAYAATKRLQEEVVERAARDAGWTAWIVRPGFIYGPDNLWSTRLGYRTGTGTWVRIGGRARLPVTYVRNCADALALLAERGGSQVEWVNVVDDDLPTQRAYARQLREVLAGPRRSVTLPWPIVRALVSGIGAVDDLAQGRLALPGALDRDAAVTRWRPMQFSNRKLKELGWSPAVGLARGLAEST